MSEELTIAERIAAKRRDQDPNDLRRKALKAARPGWWTQEDIDYLNANRPSDFICEFNRKVFGEEQC